MSVNAIWYHQRGVVWAMDLANGELPARIEPRVAARFEELGPDSAVPLAEAMGQSDIGMVRSRLGETRRSFAAWIGDEIASYCWISQEAEQVGEMERRIRLADGEAYIWDCATVPRFRRQGLYTALLGFINHRLAADGLRTIWIGSNKENVASLRAFAKAGYQPISTMTYSRLGKLSLLLMPGASGAPQRLVNAVRRTFTTEEERWWGPLAVGWREVERFR